MLFIIFFLLILQKNYIYEIYYLGDCYYFHANPLISKSGFTLGRFFALADLRLSFTDLLNRWRSKLMEGPRKPRTPYLRP